jgi:2OG-Fe dioxygenase
VSAASPWTPPDLSHAWKELTHRGYALIADWTLGIPDDLREQFHRRYFNDVTLRHDPGDWPQDRQRARDVVYYKWSGSKLKLKEYKTIAITDRADIKGKRVHKRVRVLADEQAAALVRTMLCLVPPERRQSKGTFGINFFRTYTDVVTKPHQDDEEFIILYVMHRKGDGAKSYLYREPEASGDGPAAPASTQQPGGHQQQAGRKVLDHQLDPGQLLVFEDKLFKHGATPLEEPEDGQAMRDVVVLTVDYQTTYLRRSLVSQGTEPFHSVIASLRLWGARDTVSGARRAG